jgi:putative CocE/NonD family hydrolase
MFVGRFFSGHGRLIVMVCGPIGDLTMAMTFVPRTIKLIAIFTLGVSSYYAVASSIPPSKSSNYIIDKNVVIHADDGATLCALVVRPSGAQPRATAFEFTIYVDPTNDLRKLEYAASRGYAGVIAYTRGKGECNGQTEKVVPYEEDGRDANSVIDWIAKQSWSNGKVGMMGGSYDGFTQWATAKFANEHLSTIVPVVPNNPGNGLPLQNSVFILPNYAWIYYVTDNRTLDNETYNDPKWARVPMRWYRSGRPYSDIDAIAGTTNPWLHKWLQHPSYDAYWQGMSPYRSDYARIKIPVLTIAGYYGDSAAVSYFIDFQRYSPAALNYLVAGPWDHFGSQGQTKPDVLRGYRIDPAAHIDTWQLTFDWFDFVMNGKPLPALIQNRVNYEVMGENLWRHAPTLNAMGSRERFYLTSARTSNQFFLLSTVPQTRVGVLAQEVNLADHTTMNNDSYPNPILGKKLDLPDGYAFLTAPFSQAKEVSGLDGVFHLRVNKHDLDVGIALYEVLPNGQLFQLTYYTERASYANDMSVRHLLTPGKEAAIPFEQNYLFSRLIQRGSRLLLTVTVNKNAFAEVNYGAGRDVSKESVKDAGAPMKVDWLTSSYIGLRLRDPAKVH